MVVQMQLAAMGLRGQPEKLFAKKSSLGSLRKSTPECLCKSLQIRFL